MEELRRTPVLDIYLSDFGLTREDLKNKRILDLGAGQRQFAFDCEATGLGQVWSMADVRWDWLGVLRMMEYARRMKKESEEIEMWKKVGQKSLEALMQMLPFAGGSFDLVLSRDALMPRILVETETMIEAYKEAIRVLAPGGRLLVMPAWFDNWTDEEKQQAIEVLAGVKKIEGVSVELRPVERQMMGMKIAGELLVLQKL